MKQLSELNQKRKDFLEDMIQYYVGHPDRRNFKPEKTFKDNMVNVCRYSPHTTEKVGISEGCAIGRKLPPMLALKLDVKFSGGASIAKVFGNLEIREEIPEDLKILGLDFLWNVQSLHDREQYWKEGQLTNSGKTAYSKIDESIRTNVYTSEPALTYLTIL